MSKSKINLVNKEEEFSYSTIELERRGEYHYSMTLEPTRTNCKLTLAESLDILKDLSKDEAEEIAGLLKDELGVHSLFLHMASDQEEAVTKFFKENGFIIIYSIRVPISSNSEYQVHMLVISKDNPYMNGTYKEAFKNYPVKLLEVAKL